jgi:hypothetical protein
MREFNGILALVIDFVILFVPTCLLQHSVEQLAEAIAGLVLR